MLPMNRAFFKKGIVHDGSPNDFPKRPNILNFIFFEHLSCIVNFEAK